MLNGIATELVGTPVSVVSLADVEAMPWSEYQGWLAFTENHLQRLVVSKKARTPKR